MICASWRLPTLLHVFVAVSSKIIGWAASWVTAFNFHADAMTF